MVALAQFIDVDVGLADMIQRTQQSVVQIRSGNHGAGSGIIWSNTGLIVTNHHVVARNSTVTVLLHDDHSFDGNVIASDPVLDLALVQINGVDLPAAVLADNPTPRVGEVVVAVGNPWGQRGFATLGIVSGVGAVAVPWRNAPAQYLLSDVQLAPGNSGGALVNARGEVVGINAMIFGGDLSVAIPAHLAQQFIAVSQGDVPKLGVELQPVQVQRGTKRQSAVMITHIEHGSLAANAGLFVGDVLLAIHDQPFDALHTLRYALLGRKNGTPLHIRVLRGEHETTVTI